MQSDGSRIVTTAVAVLAVIGALLLALFDWAAAFSLIGALLLGWLILLAMAIGSEVYRRHRGVTLAGAALVAIALLVVLRPDGAREGNDTTPSAVSVYGAELWPNRLASEGAFILRERIVTRSGETTDGRANVMPVSTGPLMRELRFAPGAGTGVDPLELADDGAGTIVVNPIENADVHHARAGSVSRVELPIGPVVRVELDRLPGEARVAYLVGAGRSLAPVASAVMPLRRMPRPLAVALFVLLGALVAKAWSDRIVAPLRRRFTDKPRPPAAAPGRPAGPIERAPLIPRRK